MNLQKKSSFLTALFILFLIPSVALANDSYKRLLSLVDYIGGDYQNAVNNGQIVSQEEYDEMTDFSDSALLIFSTLENGNDYPKLKQNLEKLELKIGERAPVEDIKELTGSIKKELIASFNIDTYPPSRPSLNKGSELYSKNCTSCHGEKGGGDGILAANFEPSPTNFKDPGISMSLSPFKIYNTVNFGIEGTAMPAFSSLTDKEKWDVAFYLASIAFPDGSSSGGPPASGTGNTDNYKTLSTMSNAELAEYLNLEGSDVSGLLKSVRNNVVENNESHEKNIQYTISGLNEATGLYRNGDRQKALDKAIEAYLEGYELVENDLIIVDKKLALKIESDMTAFRSEIKSGAGIEQIETISAGIISDLNSASKSLSDRNSFNSAVLFTNSFSIIVREALEALLIIAAIIAFMVNTGSRRAVKYIHYGWVTAIFAGLLTWYLARTIISISGASREIIEGTTALLAAVVLFYVSYWLISKIEVEKWKEFIQTKVEKALNKKSVIALAAVSFLAVYREAFETVLFYQALGYQADGNLSPIIWGFIAGTAIMILLAFFIFKLAIRIPLKYFFSVTSLFLYLLCFILVGKGIHELQEAGVIGVTLVKNFPRIDIIGVYPTMETLIPQSVILIAFLFASFWVAYVSREKERKEIAVNVSQISHELKTMYESFDHIKGHILEWRRCEDIDIEANDLDRQIHDVIDHVDELQTKLGNFYENLSNPSEDDTKNLN